MPTIIIHSHKHGNDASVYETAELAREQVCLQNIEPFIDELRGIARDTVKGLIATGQWQAAITAWEEAQMNCGMPESIEFFDDVPVITAIGLKTIDLEMRPRIHCPHCKCDNLDSLSITETFTGYHSLRGYDKEGTVLIENALGTSCPSESFDDGASDYKLSCGNCGKVSESAADLNAAGLGAPEKWDWV